MAQQSYVSKAVILVAGLGTRLLPATKSQPKEMLPVGRKPVVQYVVEEMETGRNQPDSLRHGTQEGLHRRPLRP